MLFYYDEADLVMPYEVYIDLLASHLIINTFYLQLCLLFLCLLFTSLKLFELIYFIACRISTHFLKLYEIEGIL